MFFSVVRFRRLLVYLARLEEILKTLQSFYKVFCIFFLPFDPAFTQWLDLKRVVLVSRVKILRPHELLKRTSQDSNIHSCVEITFLDRLHWLVYFLLALFDRRFMQTAA